MNFRQLFATMSFSLLLMAVAQTTWPTNVGLLSLSKGQISTASSQLESGAPLTDLAWASTSSMACFPATENAKFRGNHVFFAATMPARSELVVKVIPKNPAQDVSLYGYQVGATIFTLPPAINRAVSCEYDARWDRPKAGRTQDHTRSIKFTNPTGNTYNILVAVSGPEAARSGEFSLEFDLK